MRQSFSTVLAARADAAFERRPDPPRPNAERIHGDAKPCGQAAPAIDAFNHVATSKVAPVNDRANAYLWLGKIYDTGDQRSEALQQYDAILALDCDSNIKAQAEQFKRKPYK